MFINRIFPRELQLDRNYEWNGTFIKLSNIKDNSIEIEEVEEKPPGIRAVDLLTQLDAFVSTVYQPYFNECTIKLACLNASKEKKVRRFNNLKYANQVINQIALRVLLGYENAYLKLSSFQRVALCMQTAIYLLFGWETERDKLHKLQIHIYRTLHAACQGMFPASAELYRRNAEFYRKLILENSLNVNSNQ
ncbi:MAG: hypothetical protein Q8L98_08210 [Chlamydiales bacterium]|nr:hypothetical protein [Chlamydiales bacterium]